MIRRCYWAWFLRRMAVLSGSVDGWSFCFWSLTAAALVAGRGCLHPLQNSTLRISNECSAEWRIHTERRCQILLYVSVFRLLLRDFFSRCDSSSSDATVPPAGKSLCFNQWMNPNDIKLNSAQKIINWLFKSFFLRMRTLVLLKSVADSTHIYIWLHTGNIALNLKSLSYHDKFSEGSKDRLRTSYHVQGQRPGIAVF